MIKELSISSGVLKLIISSAPVADALAAMPADAHLVAVKSGWAFGEIEFASSDAALPRAKELVASGWSWAE